MHDPVPLTSLAALRLRVAQIEGRCLADAGGAAPGAWRFGVDEIDAASGGLRAGALHLFRPAGFGDTATANGLAATFVAHAAPPAGDVLWVTTARHGYDWGRPYAPALARLYARPERLLVVEARRTAEAGWAIEEGLRSGAFAVVLGTGVALGFAETRRLALAAAAHESLCLLVDAHGPRPPLAAETLWEVAARPSLADAFDAAAPGAPAWRLRLLRARGAAPAGPWDIAWNDAAHRFRLAAGFADRAAGPAARPAAIATGVRAFGERRARA
jgi:protein ImuA